jgi:hypothetical protein
VTRLRLPLLVLLASMLLTMFALRYLRAANKDTVSLSAGASRTPVLVELFTSEGCSSCPPADALLQKLDRSQPVPNADLVVLSEHVDYWDDGGWKDPYSSHIFSIRQAAYARRLRLEAPYTPQMVVDGSAQLVGSDEREALHAIATSAKTAKLPVALSSIRLEDANAPQINVEAHLEVHLAASVASAKKSPSAQVWIALADDSDQSNVRHGENGGRTLTHAAVVRSLTEIGLLDHSGGFSGDAKVSAQNANPRNLRVIAVVQEVDTGRVLGIASNRLDN